MERCFSFMDADWLPFWTVTGSSPMSWASWNSLLLIKLRPRVAVTFVITLVLSWKHLQAFFPKKDVMIYLDGQTSTNKQKNKELLQFCSKKLHSLTDDKHKSMWYFCDSKYLTLRCSEADFLDAIGTKVLRVFILAIHSHLYKRILLFTPPPSAEVVCNVTLNTETSSLRTLKIMPGNLSKILRSWIRLQYSK